MFRKISFLLLILSVTIALISCQSEDMTPVNPVGDNSPDTGWNIPENQILSGGPPKDGIPSLFNPETIPAAEARYLQDPNLVVGIVVNGQAIAYPHQILDWHEVVNEDFSSGGKLLTVSYCPLTGTAIVFRGRNAGRNLTFGVSGLLFNNNLIMFDRQTDSHWPQMRLQSDEGVLRNTKQIVYPSIETSWKTWKKLYPNTVVLSTDTGHSRPYGTAGSAYPGYTNLNSSPLFRNAVSFLDSRLPPKQRIHGVFSGEGPDSYKTKVYLIDLSQTSRLINDSIDGDPILVIDSGENNFVVSYSRNLNGQTLIFSLNGNVTDFPFTFKDNETGSTWNVLGEAIDGPLAGMQLEQTKSFNAYWFAWGTFYLGSEIYQN